MCTSSVGYFAQLAAVAEVCAPKAGNVHPQTAFDDTTWLDFVASSLAIRSALDLATQTGVGNAVLASVQATQQAVGQNTNLGMILLMAPMCAVPLSIDLASGIDDVLASLTENDTTSVYEAIRMAKPGGLGRTRQFDVAEPPACGLLEAMAVTSHADMVARQYVTGFKDVLKIIGPRIAEYNQKGKALDQVIVQVHLEQMARQPDSLIIRKCGESSAKEAQARAACVLATEWPNTEQGQCAFNDFDKWLRADGNRRNPGTSADLIAAGLFSAIRSGWIQTPFKWSSSQNPWA